MLGHTCLKGFPRMYMILTVDFPSDLSLILPYNLAAEQIILYSVFPTDLKVAARMSVSDDIKPG